jgi:hypothetical protein
VAKIDPPRKAANARRLLYASWSCLVAGAVLYAASFMIAGIMLRAVAPWVIYAGVILLFLYIAVRTNGSASGNARDDAIAFGQTTTMFHDGETKPAAAERASRRRDAQETKI